MGTEAKPAGLSVTKAPVQRHPKRGTWTACAVFLCFLVIAVTGQIAAGAYNTELAGYFDESGHAVTGLAVEQYLVHGLGQSPKQFFTDYYQHYQRVALGHWPPMLYLVEAAAMLAASPSKYSLLGVEAILAAMLALLVFRELKTLVGTAAAALGGVALLLNREVQAHTSMAMAEILLTLTMFLACLAFARFAEHERTRDAVWFGLWTSAAVLTKGTGWALLMVPAVVIAVTGKWRLLWARPLHLAALVIAVFCLPWQIATLKVASEGWTYQAGWAYSSGAAPQFLLLLFLVPGIPITAAALIGAVPTPAARRETGSHAYRAALAALVAAAWLFHVLIPAGVESRKLIIAIPPLFVLAGAGARQLGRWISPRSDRAAALTFASLAVAALMTSLPVDAKPRIGLVPVGAELNQIMPPRSAVLLVASGLDEGAMISEVALRHPNPAIYLLRGSKLLASVDWNGNDYRGHVHSEEDCARLLASVPVSFVVLDRREDPRMEYVGLIEGMLHNQSAEWTLVKAFPSGGMPNAIQVYRRNAAIQPLHYLPDWVLPQLYGLK